MHPHWWYGFTMLQLHLTSRLHLLVKIDDELSILRNLIAVVRRFAWLIAGSISIYYVYKSPQIINNNIRYEISPSC